MVGKRIKLSPAGIRQGQSSYDPDSDHDNSLSPVV
jgi:hypothetical protein